MVVDQELHARPIRLSVMIWSHLFLLSLKKKGETYAVREYCTHLAPPQPAPSQWKWILQSQTRTEENMYEGENTEEEEKITNQLTLLQGLCSLAQNKQ